MNGSVVLTQGHLFPTLVEQHAAFDHIPGAHWIDRSEQGLPRILCCQEDNNQMAFEIDTEREAYEREDGSRKVEFGKQVTIASTDNSGQVQRRHDDVVRCQPERDVAIKQLDLCPDQWRGKVRNPLREYALMKEYGDGEHILEPVALWKDGEHLYMVLESGCTSLLMGAWHLKRVAKNEKLYQEWVFKVFKKILKILDYLYRKDICHHDIKPDNFLFLDQIVMDVTTDKGTVEVQVPDPESLVAFDFEMAHRIPRRSGQARQLVKTTARFGTRSYLAPEACQPDPPHEYEYDGVAIDLWSGAMCLAYMLMGRHIFDAAADYEDRLRWVLQEMVLQDPGAGSLLDRLLVVAKRDRRLTLGRLLRVMDEVRSFSEVLNHEVLLDNRERTEET